MTQGKCCGVVEQAAAAAHKKSEQRRSNQPWVVRKLMVVVTFGIMVYAAYVYIGRLCVPMIRRRSDAGAGRGTGIALVLVFAILYLWMIWAYIKVVITSPGFAKDYVSISERPVIPPTIFLDESCVSSPHTDTDMELGRRDRHLSQPQSIDRGLAGPSYEDLMERNGSIVGVRDTVKPNLGPDIDVRSKPPAKGTQRSSITPSSLRTQPSNTFMPASPIPTVVFSSPQDKHLEKAQQREVHLHRRPPTTAVLLPFHRYCQTDEFVKPYRAHHCRSCGTCVLKYDHHCPWIGQCVGARNYKFFINFCQATVAFTSFTIATLIPFLVRIDNAGGDLDIQKIVIIGLSGLFLLFTSNMLIINVGMILSGTTTVEMLQRNTMNMQERKLLRRFYSWWEFSAKAQKRREWDKEWGALSTEGNIWWKGSQHAEWVDVMGVSWLGWIFPVGRGLSDGLTYPVNPRFDEEGRWRRRADWPEELR